MKRYYITPKLNKALWIIAFTLLSLVLFAFIYGAYDSYMFYKYEPISHKDDMTIQEWTVDYANDLEMLDRIDKDLIEAEKRIDNMINQCEMIIGDK